MQGARRKTFAAGVVVLLSACGKPPEPAPKPVPPPPPTQTIVLPAKPAPVAIPLLPETVAELQGSAETQVLAKESGYLVRQLYKENAMVAAGDALFIIDPHAIHPEPIIPGKNDLGLVTVIAPTSGALGRALHGAGDWINAHDELATVARIDPIRAVFSTSHASDLSRQAFALVLEDGNVYPARGKIESITAAGVNVGVCVVFPNPDHVLWPGEFVKVRGVAP